MIFSSTVWSNNKMFSNNYTPVLNIAKIYRHKKEIHHEWHILVLEGYQYYSGMVGPLKDLNCHLLDASSVYQEILAKYRGLYELYIANGGHNFHFNNTIRWLVASNYFNNANFLHTDIDLVINDEPQSIVGNDSLYMGSTCFVYIKNTAEFVDLYSSLLWDYASDNQRFHEQCKNLIEDQHQQNPWNIFGRPFLDEEGLFYIFLRKNGYDWTSNTSDQYIYIPFMADMLSNIETTYNRLSVLKPKHNEYKYKQYRHYLNNKPMAYMHYQYNFRLILAFYLLQKRLNIPNEMLYCPDIKIETLINNNMANQQQSYRQNNYINNFTADFLLGKLLFTLQNTTTQIDGFKPEIYRNILSLENQGLEEVLNNNFWYSKEVFV